MEPRLRIIPAAAYLGISSWKLRREAQAGQIPHVLIAGRYEFERQALDDYLEAHRVPANPQVRS